MAYGLKVQDKSGNQITLTADDATIISSGTLTMPTALNGDNTYGADIELPVADTPEADIGVFIVPNLPVIYSKFRHTVQSGNELWASNYADSTKTYYTRNDSTGVMTSWAAGAMTNNNRTTWDPIISVFPVAFWDKMGETTFTNVRLFAATCYLVVDTSVGPSGFNAGTNITAYGIGNSGVTEVNYVVCTKKYG